MGLLFSHSPGPFCSSFVGKVRDDVLCCVMLWR